MISQSYKVDKEDYFFCLANRTLTDETFNSFTSDYVTSPVPTKNIEIKLYVFVGVGQQEGVKTASGYIFHLRKLDPLSSRNTYIIQ